MLDRSDFQANNQTYVYLMYLYILKTGLIHLHICEYLNIHFVNASYF